MATSGTINATRINTAKLIEKSVRRCGLSPATLTPESIETAKESLFMLLLSLSNRGLNLWCIDKQLQALIAGKATYILPNGTQDLLNVLQATHTEVGGTDVITATDFTRTTTAATVVRYAVNFSTAPASFTFESSTDGVTWVVCDTVSVAQTVNQTYWYDVDPGATGTQFRIHSAGHVVSSLYLSSSNREIAITAMNRDDYSNQPNKLSPSATVTSYFFEKLVTPQVTYWPVPTDATRCVVMYRYRQIEDVGGLTNELEIPSRWYEDVCWQLALRLAFELPGVAPERLAAISGMCKDMTIEAESGETDGSPTYFVPGIGVYNQ